jgi:hypothetical protein
MLTSTATEAAGERQPSATGSRLAAPAKRLPLAGIRGVSWSARSRVQARAAFDCFRPGETGWECKAETHKES